METYVLHRTGCSQAEISYCMKDAWLRCTPKDRSQPRAWTWTSG